MTTSFLIVRVSQQFECVIFLEIILFQASVETVELAFVTLNPAAVRYHSLINCLVHSPSLLSANFVHWKYLKSKVAMVSALIELIGKWEC